MAPASGEASIPGPRELQAGIETAGGAAVPRLLAMQPFFVPQLGNL